MPILLESLVWVAVRALRQCSFERPRRAPRARFEPHNPSPHATGAGALTPDVCPLQGWPPTRRVSVVASLMLTPRTRSCGRRTCIARRSWAQQRSINTTTGDSTTLCPSAWGGVGSTLSRSWWIWAERQRRHPTRRLSRRSPRLLRRCHASYARQQLQHILPASFPHQRARHQRPRRRRPRHPPPPSRQGRPCHRPRRHRHLRQHWRTRTRATRSQSRCRLSAVTCMLVYIKSRVTCTSECVACAV